MPTVLLCGVDLLIRGKLEALLPEHRFTTSDGVDPPDLVIADIARVDANDVVDRFPDVPILGYTNHTDTEGLRRAHAAGFDQVVAKSALFERGKEVIDSLIRSLE
jgi:DNA-binding NarL/FixJ family response regulator